MHSWGQNCVSFVSKGADNTFVFSYVTACNNYFYSWYSTLLLIHLMYHLAWKKQCYHHSFSRSYFLFTSMKLTARELQAVVPVFQIPPVWAVALPRTITSTISGAHNTQNLLWQALPFKLSKTLTVARHPFVFTFGLLSHYCKLKIYRTCSD